MNVKFSIIIPCYNEELNIPELLSQIEVLAENSSFEFILVNNGSNDSTLALLRRNIRPYLLIIDLPKNVGYGGGIKAGIDLARGEFIGWIHADLQYSLVDSLRMTEIFSSDIKFLKGRRKGRNLFQLFISANMSFFESLLFRKILYDINAQPTIFHRSLLNDMNEIPNDFSIDLYTYLMAKKAGITVKRFQVDFIERKAGKSSWNSGLWSIIRMSVRTIKYSFILWRKL
jgi:glycosyltransferase involved in cell wall biosynthesis